MTGELRVYSDAAALAAAVADLFVDSGRSAIANRGSFRVALAGGNTPRAAYQLLARSDRASQLSWRDVFVYFGDERCVPPDNELSNYRMARTTFLDAAAIPAANVHRMRGEADPATAAREYADLLRGDYKQSEYGKVILPFTVLRRLDCVLEGTKSAVLGGPLRKARTITVTPKTTKKRAARP